MKNTNKSKENKTKKVERGKKSTPWQDCVKPSGMENDGPDDKKSREEHRSAWQRTIKFPNQGMPMQ